jgi:Polyketide cyclase / dehydrase and lipid transport
MAESGGMVDVQVSEQVAADPQAVYTLVSNLTRMGEWSPENRGGRWLSGATGPAVGAKFKGANRKGFRRWSTTSTVTVAEPGRHFAFTVTYGPVSIADWAYRIEPAADGCTVTEEWTDHRPAWMRAIYPLVMGVHDRTELNRENMQTTLRAVKAAAESGVAA